MRAGRAALSINLDEMSAGVDCAASRDDDDDARPGWPVVSVGTADYYWFQQKVSHHISGRLFDDQ